jgi:hypothetical protein
MTKYAVILALMLPLWARWIFFVISAVFLFLFLGPWVGSNKTVLMWPMTIAYLFLCGWWGYVASSVYNASREEDRHA